MIGMLPQNDKEAIHELEATISRRSLSDVATGERSGYPSRQKPTPVRRHLGCYGRGSRVRTVMERRTERLVPDISQRASRHNQSRRSGNHRSRRKDQRQAHEGCDRSRLPRKIQHPGHPEVREGPWADQIPGHNHRTSPAILKPGNSESAASSHIRSRLLR